MKLKNKRKIIDYLLLFNKLNPKIPIFCHSCKNYNLCGYDGLSNSHLISESNKIIIYSMLNNSIVDIKNYRNEQFEEGLIIKYGNIRHDLICVKWEYDNYWENRIYKNEVARRFFRNKIY